MQYNPSVKQLAKRLLQWLTSKDIISSVLIPYIVQDTYVSKRLIYWTVSHYAQFHAISIVQPKYVTHVFEQYSNHLRMFNRKLFDVFCRQPYILDLEMSLPWEDWKEVSSYDLCIDTLRHVYDSVDGHCVIRTSLGQLNFFYWAFTNGILAYVRKYSTELLRLMKSDSRKRKSSEPEAKRPKIAQSTVVLYRPRSFDT